MNQQLYTITGKTDGFGAQYQSIMSGIAFCEFKNYKYIHTPFIKIEHNVDVKQLNDFIGIKTDKINNIQNIIKEPNSSEVHNSTNPSIFYTNNVISKIRDFYYSTEKPSIPKIDIAIHIRRGDVSLINEPYRYTSNETYLKIIKFLKIQYPIYNIKIFSEGKIEDFKDFNLEDECFVLNEDITNTFHSLVTAKILIMSKSSFSYSAAILNSNKVYYIDFWHKKLNNWIDLNSIINI